MGYYTRYELETSDGHAEPHEQALCEISGYSIDMFSGESIKWYDHEDHLKQHSLKHPDVVFFLKGEGEESGDIWAKWFKSGEMQVWRLAISLPDIDHPPSPWPSATPGPSSAD